MAASSSNQVLQQQLQARRAACPRSGWNCTPKNFRIRKTKLTTGTARSGRSPPPAPAPCRSPGPGPSCRACPRSAGGCRTAPRCWRPRSSPAEEAEAVVAHGRHGRPADLHDDEHHQRHGQPGDDVGQRRERRRSRRLLHSAWAAAKCRRLCRRMSTLVTSRLPDVLPRRHGAMHPRSECRSLRRSRL